MELKVWGEETVKLKDVVVTDPYRQTSHSSSVLDSADGVIEQLYVIDVSFFIHDFQETCQIFRQKDVLFPLKKSREDK